MSPSALEHAMKHCYRRVLEAVRRVAMPIFRELGRLRAFVLRLFDLSRLFSFLSPFTSLFMTARVPTDDHETARLGTYATAADLPAELIDRILDFIDPKLIQEEPAVEMTKRQLGLVALSCKYWAQRCQARIFEELILRSDSDVYNLLAFLKDKKSCISRTLRFVILEVSLLAGRKAWLHVAFAVLSEKVFLVPTPITLKITDEDQAAGGPDRRVFAMKQCLPKSVPPPARLSILRLTGIAFKDFEDLVRLVGNIRPLYTFSCRRVTWKSTTTPARSFHLPSSLTRITVSECTLETHVYKRLFQHHRSITARSRSFASSHVGSVEGASLTFIVEMIAWLDPFVVALADAYDGHLYVDRSDGGSPDGFRFAYDRTTQVPRMRPLSPRMRFALKYDSSDDLQAPRPGFMPSAHVQALVIEFVVHDRQYGMDDIKKCDWHKFDELVASLPRLLKVFLCFQSAEDVKTFQDDILPDLDVLTDSAKLELARPWLENSPFWCLNDSPSDLLRWSDVL